MITEMICAIQYDEDEQSSSSSSISSSVIAASTESSERRCYVNNRPHYCTSYLQALTRIPAAADSDELARRKLCHVCTERAV